MEFTTGGESFEDQLKNRVEKVMGLPVATELVFETVQTPHDFSNAAGTEFVALPKDEIPALAERYVRWLETAPTPETCKCEWRVHPDDENVDVSLCKNCGQNQEAHDNPPEFLYSNDKKTAELTCATFVARKRRLRHADEHPRCPVHTKVGRVCGFFEWVFLVDAKEDNSDSARG